MARITSSDELLHTRAPMPPFPRTTCACKQCVQCCYDQPAALIPGDLERIARFLNEPFSDTLRYFWASPGALLGDRGTGRTFRIGTITPRYEGGKCVFLDADNRCRIHAVAPAGCAYFDTHQTKEEGQQRGMWVVSTQADAGYQALRATLPIATHYRPRSAR